MKISKLKIAAFLKNFPQTEVQKKLAPLTTFDIGGPADLYYKLTENEKLPELVASAQKLKIPYFILGGGSNTIFSEKGFRGLIIHMQNKKITLDSPYIIADSGILLSQVIQFALKNNLSGIEKLMGLPGTIGGAVRGNAGAFGIEIKDVFEKALIYSPKKGLQEADSNYLKFNYRESKIKRSPEIVLKVYLKLKKTSEKEAKAVLAEALDIVKNRISKQPKGKCSGSFFKNPPNNKAGYLIEESGGKGLKIGQVKVPENHANWLMNLGGATQKDVLKLSKILQRKVKTKFKIALEREVQLVNETGFISN